jgi:hypothetical protein
VLSDTKSRTGGRSGLSPGSTLTSKSCHNAGPSDEALACSVTSAAWRPSDVTLATQSAKCRPSTHVWGHIDPMSTSIDYRIGILRAANL